MRRSAIALAAVLVSTARAEASVLATEFFDDPGYSVGGTIYPDGSQDIGHGPGIGPNTGTGFTSGWQNPFFTAPRTVAPALSYAGLATSGYGAASPPYVACTYCVNSTAQRFFSANTATTDLWISFLIKDVDVTGFAANPNYGGIAVDDASNNFVYIGVPGLQPNPTAKYSLQTSDGVAQGTIDAAPGQTDLLVVHITDTGQAYLYVDPTIGAPLGLPDATIPAPFAPSAATYLHWSDSWGWTYGDIRVGTTLADVTPAASSVPEPASWALALIGLGGLLAGRRSRGRGGGGERRLTRRGVSIRWRVHSAFVGEPRFTRGAASRSRCELLASMNWQGCAGNEKGKWNRKTRKTRKWIPGRTGLTCCPNESLAAL
ncbi:MAG: PEP-CTERM sorting domain-containing protein [Acetobacteraceae bacterium]